MSQFTKNLLKTVVNVSTVVELLRYRSVEQSHLEAFTFVDEVGVDETTLTYEELDRQSRAIASQLQTLNLRGERALLLYPPGLEYLSAFLGCLYAGVVAVPAYPPRNARNSPRILAILKDAQAAVILSTTAIQSQLQSLLANQINHNQLHWLTTDHLPAGLEDAWQPPVLTQDTLAFLQYTSGSTGTPKGVMLTHENLLHNAAATVEYMEHSRQSKFVTWLPVYHDMGLIGGVLQPLFGGFPCIMMSPAAFLQRPYRWLHAISHYHGTTSGAPNFAYQLCVEKITPEQRSTLDLSSWDVAFNGAEPIRQETLERFAATFAECGFRPEAFYPCYGMAEATLMVSGSVKAALPSEKTLQKIALEQNQIIDASDEEPSVTLVGCGRSVPQQHIVIADPNSLTRCQEGEVGEIWVSGPSIGKGYWRRPTETAETFQAVLQDTGEGPFLRTGDLGFLENGELFITGRAKDLIIIRGRNLYPQDLELTAATSHPALRMGGSAAFCVEIEQQEQLVIVQELEFRAKPNLEEVTAAIRQAIAEEHEIQVYGIILIKPGTICKTSSGKIQRRATKTAFLSGELAVIDQSILEISKTQNILQLDRSILLSQSYLEDYLRQQVSQVVGISIEKIESHQPLISLGLDSLKIFELKNKIERDLEVAIEIADFFERLSLEKLAQKIITEIQVRTEQFVALNPIPRTAEFYPLSFSQQGLWFIHQLTSNTPAYNIPISIHLTGKLNIKALIQSFHEIIQRQEVFRTKFIFINQQPVQIIQPEVTFNLAIEDLRQLPEAEATATAERLTTALGQHQFNLAEPPLLKALLLHLKEEEYKLLITVHHIIADGWSIGVLIRELSTVYQGLIEGKSASLPQLTIQPVDFAMWQRQRLNSERLQTLLTYWKQQLSGELPVLNLPFDGLHPAGGYRPRSPVQTYNGNRAKLQLSESLSQKLKTLSDQENSTLFMTLLAAFKTLLYRYTGQTDIVVGSPVANRNVAEIESLIGLFVNVLVLRTNLSRNLSFRTLLSQVKSTALEAYQHQDLPFYQLVEELQPQRDLSYNPLFQVMFVLQNMPMQTPELSDLSLTFQEGNNGTSKFDLTWFMEETEQGLMATVEYNTDLFNSDTVNRMLGHFQILLEGIIENPDTEISTLPLLTTAEKHQLLFDWNQTQKGFLQTLCIHQLIEQQVEKTPDAIALIFNHEKLTYRELNEKANTLAHFLKSLGVKPETLVGICLERSIDLVIGLLAILKAGGAYLPLDPSYPPDRLAFMVEDSQAPLLLTQRRFVNRLSSAKTRLICLDQDWEIIQNYSKENPKNTATSENLAYLIYTSGSTGRPKGVAIEHRNTVAFISWARQVFTDEELAGVLASTSICFDLSIFELFVPLSWGGKVILAQNALALSSLPVADQVTLINTVPSAIAELLRLNSIPNSVQTINLGGEPLSLQLVQQLYEKKTIERIYNLYGPSEDTTYSTYALINREDTQITIGRPIANTQIYILDQQFQPVPIGVTGEIYIGGLGLAREYLNQPELTAGKFIAQLSVISHQSSVCTSPRLYKTGDLGRYLPDGRIEFLGRIDHQVKIRGFRIELGEVEAVLRQHPEIQDVVVMAREDSSQNYHLVAYIVPSLEAKFVRLELRDYLKEKLPDYMIPSAFVELKTFPLTPNGKVDRKALPTPENQRLDLKTTYEAPQSELENAIAQIWREILQLEKVGIQDNFFDLGGNSLLMVQVNHKLRQVLNREISIIEMFQNPTIKSLAQSLKPKSQETSTFQVLNNRVQRQIASLNRQKSLMKGNRGQ